ncbi:MAG: tyrosine-protein kinase, partial [Thermoleophilaceae bacterium]|nr:tyrosine-protein kinase [Thermoleophilaceae bacterium]
SLFSGTSFTPGQSLHTVARLIRTTGVAEIAAKFIHPPPASPRSMLNSIVVTPDVDAGFITITATADTPKQSADIANAFASAVVTNRQDKAVAELNRTIAGVKQELGRIAPTDQTGRNQLSEQLQRLRAVRAAQGSNAEVVEPATLGGRVPVSHSRTTTLSIILGIMLGIGAVFLAEAADRRLRSPSEFEDLTGLPLLSAIPSNAFDVRGSGASGHAEAFQALRGALTYFNIDRPLKSVVITSAGQQDGKTTVATQLALSMARAGKRVILVDADLRRPDICARLGMQPTPGLGAVLVGEQPLNAVLAEYPVDDPGAGRLVILPAGPPPPNPSELLSSQNMRDLIGSLESQADLVIIDTAAALAVSDALPLLRAVTGVVLVARMEQSTRDAVRRLQRVILNAGGTFFGVVATGASSGSGYSGYAYDVYTRVNGDGLPRPVNFPRLRRRQRNRQPPSMRS